MKHSQSKLVQKLKGLASHYLHSVHYSGSRILKAADDTADGATSYFKKSAAKTYNGAIVHAQGFIERQDFFARARAKYGLNGVLELRRIDSKLRNQGYYLGSDPETEEPVIYRGASAIGRFYPSSILKTAFGAEIWRDNYRDKYNLEQAGFFGVSFKHPI